MPVQVRPLRASDDVSLYGDRFGLDTDGPRRRRSLVAVDAGEVIGVASALWSNRHPDLVAGSLDVDVSRRREGVGAALLRELRMLCGAQLEFVLPADALACASFLDRCGFVPALESRTVRLPITGGPLGALHSDASVHGRVDVGASSMTDEVEAFFERIYAERHAWAGRYIPTPGRPWIRFAGEPVEGSVTVARIADVIVAAACLTSGEFADGADAFLPPTGTTLEPVASDDAIRLMRAVLAPTLRVASSLGMRTVNVEYDTPYAELAAVLQPWSIEPVHHLTVWLERSRASALRLDQ